MTGGALTAMSMRKYEHLLPRLFPNALAFELRSANDELIWRHGKTEERPVDGVWKELGPGVSRLQRASGQTRFRQDLAGRNGGLFARLLVTFDTLNSVPLDAAADQVIRGLGDIAPFLRDEFEIQTECNQLAVELTERYEELNLVYATKDQVEFFEEGQEALDQLVHNCADYLDVSLAALILRDKGLVIRHLNPADPPGQLNALLDLLSGGVYDLIESRIENVVINQSDTELRDRVFGGRRENLLAYPIVSGSGAAIGLLATVLSDAKREFSNSDRNLIEVMAKKASRIIQTHHDSLTGLMNRSGFEFFLISTLSAARSKNLQHCVLHFNVDQLHVVNDLLGYREGDYLICQIAKTLKSSLRDSDFVARLGGDQFGILLANCSLEQGGKVAEKILAAIEQIDVVAGKRQLKVTASAGVAPLTKLSNGIVNVLASAEIACKAAKDGGRNRVEVFQHDNTMLVRRSEELEWMGRLQEALRNDEFVLYCQAVQPLVNTDGKPHFEILLRLRDQGAGVLTPGVFMPAAERYQLMPMIDRWVLRQAFAVLADRWDTIGAANPVFCINLSGQSLTNNGFLKFALDALHETRLPAANICFEITETAAISNFEDANRLIDAVKKLGCKFSLDDFGAGLSSFGYLKSLPVDYLKIDGSFVKDMVKDRVSLSMVKAIAQVGQTMGLATIAEFVQDETTIALLREIGVNYAQGYGVHKPVALETVLEELRLGPNAASA